MPEGSTMTILMSFDDQDQQGERRGVSPPVAASDRRADAAPLALPILIVKHH